MTIHDEEQGSSEWLALRANSYTASEAPAMMSASKYQTRTDLLKLKKTGIAPDVSQAQQRIFDKGHATEAMARPILELRTGDLYPIVA
ncbi:MAG: YqaJ viral recombinase family protein, partial [Pseudomonas sp.]